MGSYPRHSSHPYNNNQPPMMGPPMPQNTNTPNHHQPQKSEANEALVNPEQERHGFHLFEALKIVLKSSCGLAACTSVLWPFVPVGLVLHWVRPEWHLWVFMTNYLAMVPTANLLSFASGELAKEKGIPKVMGVVVQTTAASAVEIILCILLLFKGQYQVIQAALLGSMLANLLLCTGICFVVGGIATDVQHFSEDLVETGGGLLLLSVAALTLPAAFYEGIMGMNKMTIEELDIRILSISRYTSILLLIAFAVYLFFQLRTHDHIFNRVLARADTMNNDHIKNARRPKLTLPESLFFVLIGLTLVCLHSIFMVEQIHWIVTNRHVSDAFMGLILVPLVEKISEHLSAVDEAWDNAMDFALSHLLGSTIQTALFVSPIVVIVGWIAGRPFDLNFEIFMVVVLVFAVLIVGNFIKDRKSNYLEGALCVIFYVMIAVATWYYPNPEPEAGGGH